MGVVRVANSLPTILFWSTRAQYETSAQRGKGKEPRFLPPSKIRNSLVGRMHAPVPTFAKEVEEDWVDPRRWRPSSRATPPVACRSAVTALEAPCGDLAPGLPPRCTDRQDLSQTTPADLPDSMHLHRLPGGRTPARLRALLRHHLAPLRLGPQPASPRLPVGHPRRRRSAGARRRRQPRTPRSSPTATWPPLCSRLDGLVVMRSEEAVRFLIKVVDVCPEAASELSEATRRTVLRALDGGGDSV